MRTSRQPPRRCADDLLDRRPRPGDRRARRRRAVAGLQHRRGRPVGRARRGGRCDAVVHRDLVRAPRPRAAARGQEPAGGARRARRRRRRLRVPSGRDPRRARAGRRSRRRELHPGGRLHSRRRLQRPGEHGRERARLGVDGGGVRGLRGTARRASCRRLDAAEAAGGDWRGRQAGGIIVVPRRASRGSARSIFAWTTMPIRSASFDGSCGCAVRTAPCAGRPGPSADDSRCCPSSTAAGPRSSGPLRPASLDEGRGLLRPLLEEEPRWGDFVRPWPTAELLPNARELLED